MPACRTPTSRPLPISQQSAASRASMPSRSRTPRSSRCFPALRTARPARRYLSAAITVQTARPRRATTPASCSPASPNCVPARLRCSASPTGRATRCMIAWPSSPRPRSPSWNRWSPRSPQPSGARRRCSPLRSRRTAAITRFSRGTGTATPTASRPNATSSMRMRSRSISRSTRCWKTACSSPRTSSTASASRSAPTCPPITPTYPSTPFMRRTARKWACSISIPTSAPRSAAGRG